MKNNEKQRKVQNTENERYDPLIKQRTRHQDSLRQRSHQEMHIEFESKANGNLILRKNAPRRSQKHFLTPKILLCCLSRHTNLFVCMPRLTNQKVHSIELAPFWLLQIAKSWVSQKDFHYFVKLMYEDTIAVHCMTTPIVNMLQASFLGNVTGTRATSTFWPHQVLRSDPRKASVQSPSWSTKHSFAVSSHLQPVRIS